jgi:small subunit ribosomal protein S3Ae
MKSNIDRQDQGGLTLDGLNPSGCGRPSLMGKTKGKPQGGGGRKGGQRKTKVASYAKKEWRHVFVPGYFKTKDIGFTISHKTARGKTAGDYLNDRIFEQSHQDLSGDNLGASRIFKWKSVDVQNDDVLTIFYGMRLTADKVGSLLRKYRTLIDAQVDVKTPDGYLLRVFSICFTKKLTAKKTCYAQQSKRKVIREACIATIKDTVEKSPVPELCKALVGETMEKAIVEKCAPVWQVENVTISKVKVLKAPVFAPEEIKQLHVGRVVAPKEAARPEEGAEAAPAAPAATEETS